ncbi:MAG TPA: hypothetical protein VM925_14095, partial [Labilithrix sp.]|nr:hypothetical protein [Labilithrix sp.]
MWQSSLGSQTFAVFPHWTHSFSYLSWQSSHAALHAATQALDELLHSGFAWQVSRAGLRHRALAAPRYGTSSDAAPTRNG